MITIDNKQYDARLSTVSSSKLSVVALYDKAAIDAKRAEIKLKYPKPVA
jgi:hypothetical protein